LAQQHKAAGIITEGKQNTNGYNSTLFGDHSAIKGDLICSLESMDNYWNRNVVFLVFFLLLLLILLLLSLIPSVVDPEG